MPVLTLALIFIMLDLMRILSHMVTRLLGKHSMGRTLSEHTLGRCGIAVRILDLFQTKIDVPRVILVLHFLGLLLVLPDIGFVIDRVTHSSDLAIKSLLDVTLCVIHPYLLQLRPQLDKHTAC